MGKIKEKTPVVAKEEKTPVVVTEEEKPVVEEKEEVKNDLNGFKPDEEEVKKEDTVNLVPGRVFGTSRLKVHDRPVANGGKTVIKKLLIKGDLITINLEESTETYYKVSFGSQPKVIEGFSLKKYIEIQE